MPTHRDVAAAEIALSSVYLTLESGEQAAEHGLKAVELMQAVYPATAATIAYMQLSLEDCLQLCNDRILQMQLMASLDDAKQKLTLHYGTAWY